MAILSRRTLFHLFAAVTLPAILPTAITAAAEEPAAQPKFELKDGDRVVWLGNTLIEREQKYGHWETMLSARYPDRNITFRNLGWDGDTVWAESRGIFDPPAAGYARMIDQVKGLKPTVIFLGYGNNEAFAGKDGLEPFIKQYEKLIDDLTKVSAEGVRFVVLLPMLQESHKRLPVPSPSAVNEKIEIYSDAIRTLASRRNFETLSLPGPLGDTPRGLLTTDGSHLTDYGYELTGMMLKAQLQALGAFGSTSRSLVVKADGTFKRREGLNVLEIERIETGRRFSATAKWLDRTGIHLAFRELPAGDYVLKIDDIAVNSCATNEGTWDNGDCKALSRHPDVAQYERLRQAIIAKNELYFHSWRPQNVTYLFGFRKHEQGQNAKETEEFLKLVKEKEAEIAKLKKPVPHKYELIRVEKP